MHPAFQLYEDATPELIEFLSNTTLGTNGAKYQHLDTETRIRELENPLHLSLIRNKRIIANITFSRRGKNWYVRYFAFDKLFQGTGQKSRSGNKSSKLKKELKTFFTEKLESGEVESFYAYIDPSNDKSHAAAEALGFKKTGEVYTQTFSRRRPKSSPRVEKLSDQNRIRNEHHSKFSKKSYYHQQAQYGSTYCLKNENGKIIALANANSYRWKIHRLPGPMGGTLVKIMPYIPILNNFLTPEEHKFIGIDHVWIENDDSKVLKELFNHILFEKNQKMIVWWVDKKVLKFNDHTSWGVMHALLKRTPVGIYSLGSPLNNNDLGHFAISDDFT